MIKLFEEWGVVKPFSPSLTAVMAKVFWKKQSIKRRSGTYVLGKAEKAIFWYWEFDEEEQCYREFRATNFKRAMKMFEAEKSNLWEEHWMERSG